VSLDCGCLFDLRGLLVCENERWLGQKVLNNRRYEYWSNASSWYSATTKWRRCSALSGTYLLASRSNMVATDADDP
jgi:hypothetical protein